MVLWRASPGRWGVKYWSFRITNLATQTPGIEGIQLTLLVPQSPGQPIATLDIGVTQGKDAGAPKPHTSPDRREWGHGAFRLKDSISKPAETVGSPALQTNATL